MRLLRNIRSSCTATRGLSIVRNVRSKRCSEMLGAALALFLVGIVFVATAQAQLRGGSGNVRVNIEWHEDVDLDLYVTDPCGDVLGYGESSSRSCHGFVGEWDYDDKGNGYRDDNPNAENIVWSNGAAVGGYTVDVKYFDGDVTANYTVRIFYGDRSETHSGQIGPNSDGRQRIAQFVADESVNASTLTLSARPISIAEDAGTSAITVTGELDRAAISNTVVTVTVGAQGDTAEEGTDYATVSDLTLTIPKDQTSATTTFALTLIDDDVAENDEALSISGSDSSDTDQLPLTVTGTTITIEDDDERVPPSTMVTLTASPLSVDEAAGSTTVTVTGTLDGAPRSTATTVTATVGAQDDTAEEGTDYATVSDLTLTIPKDQTSATTTFALTLIDDDVAENDEALSISGSDSSDTDQLPLTVTGTTITIEDDDERVPPSTMVTLTASPLSVDEAAGSTTVTVTGTLDGAPRSTATTVTATVGAQDDTAEEGTDYATVSDLTLTIPKDQTSATTTFALTLIDDDVAENDEALSISGSDSSDTDQLPLTVTGTTITIEDDDERVPPSTMVTLTASPLSVDEAAGSTTVTVTGTLDGAPRSTATTVTATVGAQDDTAEEGTDYATVSDLTLTIPKDQTSATTTFALTLIDDDVRKRRGIKH